jgi:replicative DNA helicase
MAPEPLSVFISYCHRDEALRDQLGAHLSLLRRQGLIKDWYDRKIVPGQEGDREIDSKLEQADIIVLLVSADFIASLYCWEKELNRSLDRHDAGQAAVIPIIVRPVDLDGAPFQHIHSLPTDRKPVTLWSDRDEAWVDVVRGLRNTVNEINKKKQRSLETHGLQRIDGQLRRRTDEIRSLYEPVTSFTGISTGFIDLDEILTGVRPSDLIVVAARPGMGKSRFVADIAVNIAIGQKVPVALFSVENTGSQTSLSMLASLGRLNSQSLRMQQLRDDDWARLTAAVSLLNEAPLFIDDTPSMTVDTLSQRVRELKQKHGLGVVIVDHLQLLVESASVDEDARIAHAAQSLKRLARELNVPVVVVSQLNRSLELRADKRPVLSDLPGYGTIEQYADVVLFIYRDEQYNRDSAEKGVAEIIVAKQRGGPAGSVRLTFLAEYGRFENYADAALIFEEKPRM